jgi:hypothetical protein
MKHPPHKRDTQRRRPRAKQPEVVDIWRTPGPLPDVEPIAVPQNVLALIRSLGDPPMHGSIDSRDYFDRVVERSATVAAALALSAELLADPDA